MFRFASIILFCSLVFAGAVQKTVLDLMNEGRFAEAQSLIADNTAGARYAVLLEAMTEPNAQAACALYRKVSASFPGTDCDSLAQERLLLALDAGISIAAEEEIAEPEEQFAESSLEREEIIPEPETTIAGAEETPVAAVETESEFDESAAVEMAEQPHEPTQEQRTMLSSVQKPGITLPSIESLDKPAQKQTEETPASSGITVEYQDESKEEPAIQHAASTPEQSLIVADEQKTESSEESAEELALLEKERGVKPLPLETIPHDADAYPKKSGDWFVQVGAFGNHDNALRLAATLRSAGYPVVLVPRESESGTLMQVRVGGYETPDAGRQ
ncbi:SPOR domain-containing protein, partial [bacterium]|nr:SPOR domain-containing protein [bacterium]